MSFPTSPSFSSEFENSNWWKSSPSLQHFSPIDLANRSTQIFHENFPHPTSKTYLFLNLIYNDSLIILYVPFIFLSSLGNHFHSSYYEQLRKNRFVPVNIKGFPTPEETKKQTDEKEFTAYEKQTGGKENLRTIWRTSRRKFP